VLSEVRDQQFLLSLAFIALALGLAVAGFSVTRSIRRERRLAQLKALFVANVSHELRTPVASILLMAENLEQQRVSEPGTQARYYRFIRQEADRLRRLVNDVLDFFAH
jgi:signal transduction histidine kinase